MMPKIILCLAFILLVGLSAKAIEINGTMLNASSSGTIIKIFEWINITNISINSTNTLLYNITKTSYIYNKSNELILHNLTNSSDNITLNFNDGNIYYIWMNDTAEKPEQPSPQPIPSVSGGVSVSSNISEYVNATFFDNRTIMQKINDFIFNLVHNSYDYLVLKTSRNRPALSNQSKYSVAYLSEIESYEVINDTHVRFFYANLSVLEIQLFTNLSTQNKFLDMNIPIFQFEVDAVQPSTISIVKYFFEIEYTNKAELSQNIRIKGIRTLTLIIFLSIFLSIVLYKTRLIKIRKYIKPLAEEE